LGIHNFLKTRNPAAARRRGARHGE
jgi:hypothetical protein